ncbi:winged helix-turn-helix domain-containing protein [Halococcus agarilyticus]|uniref:winged helix-turn-helix domain-containing protein n=1 Tax=Halococcus agarilyticus TaxID=1232219 RepID=UPI0006779D72|nr:winged helix-turn-helix domain-containing protein [Halococcus agarilyticus]
MSEERDPDAMFAALCSDDAREILVAAHSEPRSAQEFADRCDISLPTVYRRVNTLVDQGLLKENLQVDPDGNHYTVYVSNLDSLEFALETAGFVASVRLRRDIVDRFGEFWRDLGGHSAERTDHQ